ncbi:lipopolysaccharide biosynthesis protein [Chryseomicrobium sp. FSL W7-1435]|uniref:lipopolysaccharide biosynthesis protein n=1 Tax=Chryseomicrobium sp. FSL W7-1435 TaxID=2921704 RepID=UPI00315AD533
MKKSLKKTTLIGFFWTLIDFFSSKGLTLIFQIALARLLTPEEFGLIGLILIFIAISNALVNSGMQSALIREPDIKDIHYSTVFFFNITISILIYILLFLSAPYISEFYDQPSLVSLIRVLGLVVLINSLSIIQRTMLIRNLNFKVESIINLSSNLLSGSIALLLAYMEFGVWSLILQIILNNLFQSILLIVLNKWTPKLNFDFAIFKYLFNFGWKLLLSGLINTFYQNFYNIFIGKFYNINMVGYYTQGKLLADVSSQIITTALQKVTYPVLSKIQNDDIILKQNYRILIKLSSFITFPIIIILIVSSNSFIILLLGEKWMSAIPFFQIICFAGIFYPIHVINLNLLQVKGRSDLVLKLEIVKLLVNTSLIILFLSFTSNIYILISTFVISSFLALFINAHYSGKFLNYGFLSQAKDVYKYLINAILTGVTLYITLLYCEELHEAYKMIILFVTGLISYIIYSKITKVDKEVFELSRKFLA